MRIILLACLLLFSCKGASVKGLSVKSVLTEKDTTGATLQQIQNDHFSSFFTIEGPIVKFQTLSGKTKKYYEVSEFKIKPHKTKFLTAADKLNNIDLKVSLLIKAKAHRVRVDDSWSEWKVGAPFPAKLFHTKITRKNGVFNLECNKKASNIVKKSI